jgi:hypothetical protein
LAPSECLYLALAKNITKRKLTSVHGPLVNPKRKQARALRSHYGRRCSKWSKPIQNFYSSQHPSFFSGKVCYHGYDIYCCLSPWSRQPTWSESLFFLSKGTLRKAT